MTAKVNVNVVIDTAQGVKITKTFAAETTETLATEMEALKSVCTASLDFANAVETYNANQVAATRTVSD